MIQSDSGSARPFIHIKPRKGWQLIDFSELKEYRDLLYFLVLRDIKVKYKQTVLGGLWAVIQPFCSMVLFSLFFGTLAKMAWTESRILFSATALWWHGRTLPMHSAAQAQASL